MIPVYKLERLPPGQRRRKLALLLAACERSLRFPGSGETYGAEYTLAVIALALEDPALSEPARAALAAECADQGAAKAAVSPSLTGAVVPADLSLIRLCNTARHALLAAIGTFPAEWDLMMGPEGVAPTLTQRRFFPGVQAYAEDIRSPFNLGSIFRTAEAFGAERVLLSPLCVPPTHPRAQRSSMGCIDYLPWEQLPLADLPEDVPVFALETGGTPIEEFAFPERGIVIVGSEELGISPEGLARATYGRVSIPMTGLKASLNVGVAFGVLMQAWTAYLGCSASNPC
jgi:TrmH family RNA methyltransferase